MRIDFNNENNNNLESPELFTFKFIIISVLVIISCLLFGYLMQNYIDYEIKKINSHEADNQNLYPLVVIDPGHGGEDGGASGINGEEEKTLNLDISKKIHLIMKFLGVPSKLTREDDRLLYDEYGDLIDYTGKKKTYDLRNRYKIACENPNSIFMGIHMNKYTQEKYSGLQVYYSPNNRESKNFAGMIQTKTKQYLQPDNSRNIQKAGSSIFLLDRLEIPAVLVECGFLSNVQECQQLTDSTYQKKMSLILFASASEFLSQYTNMG